MEVCQLMDQVLIVRAETDKLRCKYKYLVKLINYATQRNDIHFVVRVVPGWKRLFRSYLESGCNKLACITAHSQ